MNSKPEVAFSLTSKFYQCDQQVIMVGNQDSVTLRDIKVQAFGLTDGDFSSNKLDCHESVPKTAPTQNYTVVSGNTTCISMSAALTLEIKYTLKNNTNETVMVNFQKEEPASGSCSSPGNLKEEIIIKYKQNDFQILLEFGRDGKATTGLGAETFNYYIENIQITYNLGSELFPGANDTTVKTAKALNQTLYKTGSDKYYKCSAEDTFKVNDWVSLKTKDLRFVAFHTDTKEPNLFGDNANECTADTVTNSIVPIAVGAALAGLVVIVLIAYLIGRRRNHKGYESV
ncbi:lysosome-associated membrane glycoprotein 1-like [Liolophura sinensis]|uniref:lysosome-associated membrane glycoprotein 1-like n=1 Tax=Liolophura sinensis TaxID=3198878 RepID=UPI003158D799